MNYMPKIALIQGTAFSGKSWLAGWIARRIRRSFVVIVHSRPDESYLAHLEKERIRFIGVHTGNYRLSASFLRQTKRRKYRYLWLSVYDLSPQETGKFLSCLIEAVKEVGNLALFIDEAHLFLSRFQVPDTVVGFIRGARHYGVDVILVSQRLRDIDIGIRCVLTHLMVFRTTDETDLSILAGELGVGKEMARKIKFLPNQKHLYVNRAYPIITAVESEV